MTQHCIECGHPTAVQVRRRQLVRVTEKRIPVRITVSMWACHCGGAFMDSKQLAAKDAALANPRIVARVSRIAKS